MPPWSLVELKQAGAILDVDSSVIEDNFLHMNGYEWNRAVRF